MKIKKIMLTGLLCLSLTTFAMAGETEGGGKAAPEPTPPTIVQLIINLFIGK